MVAAAGWIIHQARSDAAFQASDIFGRQVVLVTGAGIDTGKKDRKMYSEQRVELA